MTFPPPASESGFFGSTPASSAPINAATAGATQSSSGGVVADDNNSNNDATTMTDSTVSVSGDVAVEKEEVKTMRTSWSVGEAVEIDTDTNLPDFGIIEKSTAIVLTTLRIQLQEIP